eukprot:scaffold2243_cov165-Amphora_coffeaeformis.AAC.15
MIIRRGKLYDANQRNDGDEEYDGHTTKNGRNGIRRVLVKSKVLGGDGSRAALVAAVVHKYLLEKERCVVRQKDGRHRTRDAIIARLFINVVGTPRQDKQHNVRNKQGWCDEGHHEDRSPTARTS